MFNIERKKVKPKYFYCQRCAKECYDQPIMAKHEASGADIKVCRQCHSDLIIEKNATSLSFTSG